MKELIISKQMSVDVKTDKCIMLYVVNYENQSGQQVEAFENIHSFADRIRNLSLDLHSSKNSRTTLNE